MKISIVIPTKNRLSYLVQTIESVVNQKRKPDEIIVCDNMSSDGTVEWLKNKSNLTCIFQDKPVSMIDNWNTALSHACGDYFILLSDDDILGEDFLEKIEEANTIDYSMIIAKHNIITHDNHNMIDNALNDIRAGEYSSFQMIDLIKENVPFRLCGIAFNRMRFIGLGSFDTVFTTTAADSEIIQKMSLLGSSYIIPSDKELVSYRIWPSSLTSQKIITALWHKEIDTWTQHMYVYLKDIYTVQKIDEIAARIKFSNIKYAFNMLNDRTIYTFSKYKDLRIILQNIPSLNSDISKFKLYTLVFPFMFFPGFHSLMRLRSKALKLKRSICRRLA